MSEESSGNINKIEVVFSPTLFPVYFENPNCVVVVIDIFRATSAMCAAFESGVKSIKPVATLKAAKEYKTKGYIVGAERKAEIVKGFDFGNSPLSFVDEKYKGKEIVLTTTNGTKAIEISKKANKIFIGAFSNINAICRALEKEDKDVLLLCSGWKNRFNLEDTLFAGALTQMLSKNLRFNNLSDSAIASLNIYNYAKNDMYGFLNNSSHRKRLSRLNLEEDIIYCLTLNQTKIVPEFKDGVITEMKSDEVFV